RLADDVLARLEPAQRVGAGAGRGRVGRRRTRRELGRRQRPVAVTVEIGLDDEAADARIAAVIGTISVEVVELAARDRRVAVVAEIVAADGLVGDQRRRVAAISAAPGRLTLVVDRQRLDPGRLLRLADDVLARLEPAQRVGAGAGRGRVGRRRTRRELGRRQRPVAVTVEIGLDDEAADARIAAVIGTISVEVVELAARDRRVAVVAEIVAADGLVGDQRRRVAAISAAPSRLTLVVDRQRLDPGRLLRLADDVLARLEPARRVGAGAGRGRVGRRR